MENSLEIKINYDKNEDKPERVFKTIASLLENLENIDDILCETIPVKVTAKTYLENVESGSIKLFLRNGIAKIDDEALAQGDFLKVLGLYLKETKYSILGYLDKNIENDNKIKNLKQLQKDIFDKSRKYEIDKLKTYKTVSKTKLAKSISSLNTTFGNLTAKESITIKQDNKDLQLS